MLHKFDLFSLIIIVGSLVILSIAGLMLGSFSNMMGEELQETADESLAGSEYINVSSNFLENDGAKYADNYFFWFLVAILVGIVLMGLYLEFEPATMIIIFIVGVIVIAGAWLGSDIYSGFSEDVDVTTSGEMSKTGVLMNSGYFPLLIFVFLIILVVVMYNRKRGVDF